ncbi:16S rRNA (guanine(527)-N(7))-methyltransferase RsmG [Bacillota bacterium LX-D]|nr:16S rRNA (guanine(527)-N(7))-methyltransferase RsmG [Bacillota bacterium LX-D]
MNSWDLLQSKLKKEEILLKEDQLEKLQQFMTLLQEWNKVMNLTAIKDEAGIISKHFIDSLLYAKNAGVLNVNKVLDLGTGAGFPGIPLKIWQPDLPITLVDSLRKRINFLAEVIKILDLKNIELVHGRAEDIGKNDDYREKYDLVLSRAVASLPVLVEYCLPLVKVGGKFAAAKGPDYDHELAEGKNAVKILGGELKKVFFYTLPPTEDQRSVLLFKKVALTPAKYPRKAGQPEKSPLK